MFARVNGLGWNFADPLTHGQLNQLDINVSQAADMAAGGFYAPAAVFEVGGAGLKASGNFLATANAAFTGTQQFLGTAVCTTSFAFNAGLLTGDAFATLRWDGIGTFRNGSQVTGDPGSALNWSGSSTFSIGVFTVNSNAVFQTGVPNFKNGALFDSAGTVTFARPVVFGAGASIALQDTVTLSGGGRILPRITTGLDLDAQTYSSSTSDIVTFAGVTLTAPRTCTIADGVANAYMTVSMYAALGTNSLTLKRSDTSTITTIKNNVTGNAFSVDLVYRSGAWQYIDARFYP